MYGLFAYYLASPYNFILLFFKKEYMPVAFNLIFMLKTASSGLTMFYYLNRKKNVKWTNLIFSTCYALSTYIMIYGFNVMWLDGVILLPILISGIDDLVKYKKAKLYRNYSSSNFNHKLLYRIYDMYIFVYLFYI